MEAGAVEGGMLSRFAPCLALALLIAAPAEAQQASNPKSHISNSKRTEVTVIGCVEPERDYRGRLNAAKGGPLASGAGQSNEYVLSSAKPMPADGSALTQKEAVATSGQSGDYLLTGQSERELKQAVGRQIHVVGVVEAFKANDSAKEARDRLPQLMISTWHQVGDFCPAAK